MSATDDTYSLLPASHHPVTAATPEVLTAIRLLQEENRQLQATVLDMKRHIQASTLMSSPHPPRPVQSPRVWSLSPPEQPYQPKSQLVPETNTDYALPPPSHNQPPGRDHHAAQLDEEDWPPPPPPVADDFPQPIKNPSMDVVEDLTARMHRLGDVPPPPPPQPPHQTHNPVQAPLSRAPTHPHSSPLPPQQERIYRGPQPSIPKFTKEDPREFARLKIALENILPEDATERFKYQVLIDHLRFEEALLIADSYSNSDYPYSDTMASLTSHYGRPHQLALQRIADLMDGPTIRSGDTTSFKKFALHVRALVGMLDQLGEEGHVEL